MLDVSGVRQILEAVPSLKDDLSSIAPGDLDRICANASPIVLPSLFSAPKEARHINVDQTIQFIGHAASYASLALKIWELTRPRRPDATAEALAQALREIVERIPPATAREVCKAIVSTRTQLPETPKN